MSVITLFDVNVNQSYLSAKSQVQRHLAGLSHYADDSTLKAFNAKIVECKVTDSGKIMGLIERLPVETFDAPPSYRCVFFSVDGMGLRDDPSISYKTKKQAIKAFWDKANSLDVDTIYTKALQNLIKWRENDIATLKEALK